MGRKVSCKTHLGDSLPFEASRFISDALHPVLKAAQGHGESLLLHIAHDEERLISTPTFTPPARSTTDHKNLALFAL